MSNFLKSKAKILILTYGIIIAITLVFALAFMTNFADVHVFFKKENGDVVFNSTSTLNVNKQTNGDLFNYFANLAASGDASNPLYALLNGKTGSTVFADAGLAQKVYDFQMDMSKFNDQLIIYFCVSIVLFASLLIVSNQSRKVYYASNLVVGVVAPLVVIVYTVAMLINDMKLMSTFKDNKNLFRAVAYLQNSNIATIEKNNADWSTIKSETTKVNELPFIIGMIVFVIVIAYSVFMIIYAIYRFK